MKPILTIVFAFLLLQSSFAQLGLSEKIAQTENINVNDGDMLTARNIIVKKTADNNIIAVFNFKRNNLESILKKDARYDSVAITKFNLDGNIIWQKRIKIPNFGFVTDISNSNAGGYIVCGNSGTDNFITVFDGNGNALGSKTIPNPNNDFFFRKIEQTRNGNYVIASVRFWYKTTVPNYSWFGFGFNHLYNIDYFIGMVDATGNVLWNNKVTYEAVSFGSFWSDIRLNDYENLSSAVQPFIFEKTKVGNEEHYSFTINHVDTLQYAAFLDLFQYDSTGAQRLSKNLQNQNNNTYLTNYLKLPTGLMYVYRDFNSQTYYNDYFFNKVDKQGENLYSKQDTFITGYSALYNGYNQNAYWDYYNSGSSLAQQNDSSYLFFFTNGSYYDPNVFITKTDKNFHYNWRGDYFSKDILVNGALLITQMPDNNMLCITANGSFDYNKKGLIFYKIRNGANQLIYKVYVDKNNNAVFDGDDYYFYNAQVEITTNNISTNYQLPYSGTFNKFVDIGTYTSRLVNYESMLSYFTVLPQQKTSSFTNYNNYDTIVFRLVPKPEIQDLQISIIPTSVARPGFEATYKIIAKNVGTKTVYDISMKFLKDTLQTIELTDITPTTIIDDTLIWNIDSMVIYETREYNVTCRNAVPPTLDSDDTLTLFANITPFQNDTTSKDNFFTLYQVVVNSFDPNDKLEAHGAGITPQQLADRDYLYYTIRFQNTGTASAVNVVVKDTLENTLDWSTFEMLKASHAYTMNVSNRRNITWTFSSIYLPDSTTNEPYSHGYVHFRIRPAEGLNINSVISNRAAIYFDYNLPIFTNTMTTQILEQRVTNIKQKEIKQIKLYPSPTSNMVQLEFDALKLQNITLKVVDMQGRELHQELIKSNAGLNTVQVNLSDYANGVYLIQLNTDDTNLFYGKVLKQ